MTFLLKVFEVKLSGYSINCSRNGGVVCMFIRSDILFNPPCRGQMEVAWVELLLPLTKPIIVAVCYRPPKQTDFYELENVCSKSNICMEKECILCR